MIDTAAKDTSSEIVMPSVKLNNGVYLPVVGLGTLASTNDKTFTDLIRSALDAGYRHIDTALYYNNHKLIGAALAAIFKEGKYKREDIFITTKFFSEKTATAVDVLKSSLADLNL
jgi:aldehyde reductase